MESLWAAFCYQSFKHYTCNHVTLYVVMWQLCNRILTGPFGSFKPSRALLTANHRLGDWPGSSNRLEKLLMFTAPVGRFSLRGRLLGRVLGFPGLAQRLRPVGFAAELLHVCSHHPLLGHVKRLPLPRVLTRFGTNECVTSLHNLTEAHGDTHVLCLITYTMISFTLYVCVCVYTYVCVCVCADICWSLQ